MRYAAGSLFIFLLFASTAWGRGFVESQVEYAVDDEGNKLFSLEWSEEELTATIEMELVLTNYREDWHKGGFDLEERHSAYSTVPEFWDGCEMVEASGQIGDGLLYTKSNLRVVIRGEGCPSYLFMYRQFGVSISFYEVQSIEHDSLTPAMRLYVVDNP